MAQKETYSNFVVYGKFEVRDPHTNEVIFCIDKEKSNESTNVSSGIYSAGQINLNSNGHIVSVKSKDLTDDLRELINKVFDEREKIKEMEEEVRKKNVAIFCAQYSNNPNKYKK